MYTLLSLLLVSSGDTVAFAAALWYDMVAVATVCCSCEWLRFVDRYQSISMHSHSNSVLSHV